MEKHAHFHSCPFCGMPRKLSLQKETKKSINKYSILLLETANFLIFQYVITSKKKNLPKNFFILKNNFFLNDIS